MMNYFKHEKAIVADNAKIGEKTRIWAFSNIQSGADIGSNCNICDGCYVEKGSKIGNDVTIKNNVCIFDGITIGDKVFIGANTAFINDRYPRSKRNDPWTLEKIVVGKGATIGANSTILCGLEIGEYAFIGAGSVVTKNVAPYTLVFGNPARVNGFICMCGKKLNKSLRCSCGKSYKKNKEGLSLR